MVFHIASTGSIMQILFLNLIEYPGITRRCEVFLCVLFVGLVFFYRLENFCDVSIGIPPYPSLSSNENSTLLGVPQTPHHPLFIGLSEWGN